MRLSPRQSRILAVLHQDRKVRVDALAERFETTHQTIRKDLARLEAAHKLVRFHGGATLPGAIAYGAVDARRIEAAEAKQAIGAAIAAKLPQEGVIFVNAGTTTECVARALGPRRALRLITDNVDIAAMTRGYEGLEVLVPGGTVRGSDGAILGAEAVDFLRQFRTDYAVIGAAGIDETGAFWDYDLAEVQLCRAMMAGSQHVILAVDSTKFGRAASVRLGDLSGVHTLVTDKGCPAWVHEVCAAHEIDLICA